MKRPASFWSLFALSALLVTMEQFCFGYNDHIQNGIRPSGIEVPAGFSFLEKHGPVINILTVLSNQALTFDHEPLEKGESTECQHIADGEKTLYLCFGRSSSSVIVQINSTHRHNIKTSNKDPIFLLSSQRSDESVNAISVKVSKSRFIDENAYPIQAQLSEQHATEAEIRKTVASREEMGKLQFTTEKVGESSYELYIQQTEGITPPEQRRNADHFRLSDNHQELTEDETSVNDDISPHFSLNDNNLVCLATKPEHCHWLPPLTQSLPKDGDDENAGDISNSPKARQEAQGALIAENSEPVKLSDNSLKTTILQDWKGRERGQESNRKKQSDPDSSLFTQFSILMTQDIINKFINYVDQQDADKIRQLLQLFGVRLLFRKRNSPPRNTALHILFKKTLAFKNSGHPWQKYNSPVKRTIESWIIGKKLMDDYARAKEVKNDDGISVREIISEITGHTLPKKKSTKFQPSKVAEREKNLPHNKKLPHSEVSKRQKTISHYQTHTLSDIPEDESEAESLSDLDPLEADFYTHIFNPNDKNQHACMVCGESKTTLYRKKASGKDLIDCSFYCCIDCLKEFLRMATISSDNMLQLSGAELRCPCHRCQNEITPSSLHYLADSKIINQYYRIKLELFLSNNNNFFQCKFPVEGAEASPCDRLYDLEEIKRDDPKYCLPCGHTVCLFCGEGPYHDNEPCGARASSFESDEQLGISNCPGCGLRVFRDGGCREVKCPNCQAEFCYLCKAINNRRQSVRGWHLYCPVAQEQMESEAAARQNNQ